MIELDLYQPQWTLFLQSTWLQKPNSRQDISSIPPLRHCHEVHIYRFSFNYRCISLHGFDAGQLADLYMIFSWHKHLLLEFRHLWRKGEEKSFFVTVLSMNRFPGLYSSTVLAFSIPKMKVDEYAALSSTLGIIKYWDQIKYLASPLFIIFFSMQFFLSCYFLPSSPSSLSLRLDSHISET